MMIVAVAAGVLFYAGLILFHSREALLALQPRFLPTVFRPE